MALCLIFPQSALATTKKKFVVVIDAGHGGTDYGAIENGVNEKDVNLAVSLKLGEMIRKKLKDTEVILTRSTDEFLSLQKRADIANQAKGDLFISIHCNSVDRTNKNRSTVLGASTYVLGQHKDADNLAVARRENSVAELDASDAAHYAKFDPEKDESYIISEMAQKKNLQNSVRFASDVQREMAAAGRRSRGVYQAGFWVLWSTAMPAALIELDFICNPEQAQFLNSKEGQEKLAGAIFNAVKNYEAYYKKSMGFTAESTPKTSGAEDISDAEVAAIVQSYAGQQPVASATGTSEKKSTGLNASSIKAKRASRSEEANAGNNKEEKKKVKEKKVKEPKEKEPKAKNTKPSKQAKNAETAQQPSEDENPVMTKDEPETADTAVLSDSDARPAERRRRTETQTSQSKRTSAATHRRRSSASRKAGASQVEEANIALLSESGKSSVVNVAREEKPSEPTPTVNEKESKKKNAKSDKKEGKKSETSKPARRDKNSSSGRKAVKQSVSLKYKILLFSSDEELKANDEAFQGLSPVSSFRENNKYNYTYGEGDSFKEMDDLLKTISTLFPDARVIKRYQ